MWQVRHKFAFLVIPTKINILHVLFIRRLEEGGVLTDCSIQTQEPDETLDFDFSSADVLNKIIMKVRKQFQDTVEL